jgi:farnesyl diphosphate synthase
MLIAVSCEVGAILGEASESAKQALNVYAHNLGLAFQITDDLLDAEGNAKTVGKKTGKDKEAGKSTFVSLLGIERARNQAEGLVVQACEHLDFFGKKADPLKNMAQFVITRSA